MAEHTDEEKALYHTALAARTFIQLGQYDVAAEIMQAGSEGYERVEMAHGYEQLGE